MQNRTKKNEMNNKKMVFSALYLALALILPFLTGRIPQIGSMLCPMHIPVLLCGFVCGWAWGLSIGVIAPLLSSCLFGTPAIYPNAVAMAFELAVYGAATGLLWKILPGFRAKLYIVLICAMLLGRCVWGIAGYVLAGLGNTEFSMEIFLSGAVLNSVPGIILHVIIIPPLVMLMIRSGLMLNEPKKNNAPDPGDKAEE